MIIKPLDTKLLNEMHKEMLAKMNETNFSDEDSIVQFRASEAVRQVLVLCYEDSRAYNKLFYPGQFSLDYSPMHDEFFAAIDEKDAKGEPKNKQVVAKAFRGFGKSTICQALLSKRIRYQDMMLATYIGKNETFAIKQCEISKTMMIGSRLENFLFGSIKMKTIEDADASFSKKSWVTAYGTNVVPRGGGQPVRGMLHAWSVPDGQGGTITESHRVELFIFDDLEDDKFIDNEIYRRELKDWVIGHAIEAKPTPEMSTNWQAVYIDTLKHEDAVLQQLMDRPDWLALDLPLCDTNYKSRAPSFYSDAAIADEVRKHKEAVPSTLDIFYQEKMGLSIATEEAAFRKEYFRYYAEDDSLPESDKNFRGFREERKKLETVVIIDPAKTVKVQSADTGFVVISFNVYEHRIFVRHATGEKLYPEEIYRRGFELAKQYNARVIGYEETSLNEFIRKPMTDAMLKEGYAFELVPLKARSGQGEFSGHMGGKKGRVASMIPYYRRGEVFHNVVGCGALEVQLMSFPKSKLWDVMDATAYFVEMLDKGGRFWLPPGMLDEDPEEVEKEYADLYHEDEREEPIEDWMLV